MIFLLKGIGHLPRWCNKLLSRLLFVVIYHIVGYRRNVVVSNLKNAFPSKSITELVQIERNHYRYFSELLLEPMRLIKWDEKQLLENISFKNLELIEPYLKSNKPVVMVLGHLGNWEWAGPCMDVSSKKPQLIVYKPIKNKSFESFINSLRGKFGAQLVEMKNTYRAIVSKKNEGFTIALNADQSPKGGGNYWTTFLNQETGFFVGPEKIARKLECPVVYTFIKRIKPGKYSIELELLSENASKEAPNAVMKSFVAMLERDIKSYPETWLWTHRRWKHKSPVLK